jgi:hypothetical protein
MPAFFLRAGLLEFLGPCQHGCFRCVVCIQDSGATGRGCIMGMCKG